MGVSELFLVAMFIIFAAPYLLWRLFRTDDYAPLVVVQIVGGIILGPGLLGAVYPTYYQAIFTPQVITALNGVAWWAVMLFVFMAGIELDIRSAWQHRSETTVTAALALGTPLLFGSLSASIILLASKWSGFSSNNWIGPNGQTWQFILGVGMACAVTALPILVLFMEKLNILRSSLGQRALRYASLDDVAIWSVLAIILLDWERVARQLGFLAAFVVVAYCVRFSMHRIPEKDRWYLALIWLIANGFAADWSGLHFMVGAFLAGAVLDRDMFDDVKLDFFRDHVLFALMPVFFLSTGLRTTWEMGGIAVISTAALLLLASIAGKLIGIHLAGKILNWSRGEASIIGWLLQTKALIMIIFVNVLLDKGLITSQTFTASLLMAVGSTMLTIPVVKRRLANAMSVSPCHSNAQLQERSTPMGGSDTVSAKI